MNSVYLILAALVLSVQSFKITKNASTQHRFKIQEKEYILETNIKANFWAAFEFCALNRMKLVTLETQAENDAVLSIVEKHTTGRQVFWTSGNKLGDNNTWTWMTTGTEIVFFDWGTGEPDDVNGTEQCISITSKTYVSGSWNDINCSVQMGVICESE
ncbi:lectin subunit alpha-like [Diabrotica undecimpunctata]|uniref:lectin subunit alpha-like n=1 Tax=Diabrotica undecimpunctata TaxID=50387 RepID=UPI003B63B195